MANDIIWIVAMVEDHSPPSVRAELRRLLPVFLITDSEFDAFCLDFFPRIYQLFATQMDRMSKVNLLLEIAPFRDVLSRLKEYNPQLAAAHANIIAQLLGDEREQRRCQLESAFEKAFEQKERLISSGGDTTEIDRQLLSIRREQRTGPVLSEREILAGRYKLLELAGRGGFSDVWQAIDRKTQKLVAVKVLHTQWKQDRSRLERFQRGARRMADLDHPNVVRVLSEPLEDQGFVFFVMEYLSGGDLGQSITENKYSTEDLLKNVIEVGLALEHAHQKSLIHRDVKPQNILLDAQRSAHLTDFDLVGGAMTTGGTQNGGLGTFVYSAPEQLDDASNVDLRADVYSLGMVALSVVCGRLLPMRAIRDTESFIESANCREEIKRVIRRATNWDPRIRYSSMAALCRELELGLRNAAGRQQASGTIHTERRIDRGRASLDPGAAEKLEQFEGVWIGENGSTYCIRAVDNKLHCAYCYNGGNELTGHYFDMYVEDNRIYSRFSWIFDRSVRGYIFLDLSNANKLSGGWFYADERDACEEDVFDVIGSTVVWKGGEWIGVKERRIIEVSAYLDAVSTFPDWAEAYFARKMWLTHGGFFPTF